MDLGTTLTEKKQQFGGNDNNANRVVRFRLLRASRGDLSRLSSSPFLLFLSSLLHHFPTIPSSGSDIGRVFAQGRRSRRPYLTFNLRKLCALSAHQILNSHRKVDMNSYPQSLSFCFPSFSRRHGYCTKHTNIWLPQFDPLPS